MYVKWIEWTIEYNRYNRTQTHVYSVNTHMRMYVNSHTNLTCKCVHIHVHTCTSTLICTHVRFSVNACPTTTQTASACTKGQNGASKATQSCSFSSTTGSPLQRLPRASMSYVVCGGWVSIFCETFASGWMRFFAPVFLFFCGFRYFSPPLLRIALRGVCHGPPRAVLLASNSRYGRILCVFFCFGEFFLWFLF